MTLSDVHKTLIENGFKFGHKIVTDSTYARPTTNYILGKFYDFYREWMSDHNLYKWEQKFDCDNFASLFYTFAQICHKKSNRPEQGIAIGEMYYMQDAGGGHVINMAITEKGLILIEPQTGKQVDVTDNEKKNVMLIHF